MQNSLRILSLFLAIQGSFSEFALALDSEDHPAPDRAGGSAEDDGRVAAEHHREFLRATKGRVLEELRNAKPEVFIALMKDLVEFEFKGSPPSNFYREKVFMQLIRADLRDYVSKSEFRSAGEIRKEHISSLLNVFSPKKLGSEWELPPMVQVEVQKELVFALWNQIPEDVRSGSKTPGEMDYEILTLIAHTMQNRSQSLDAEFEWAEAFMESPDQIIPILNILVRPPSIRLQDAKSSADYALEQMGPEKYPGKPFLLPRWDSVSSRARLIYRMGGHEHTGIKNDRNAQARALVMRTERLGRVAGTALNKLLKAAKAGELSPNLVGVFCEAFPRLLRFSELGDVKYGSDTETGVARLRLRFAQADAQLKLIEAMISTIEKELEEAGGQLAKSDPSGLRASTYWHGMGAIHATLLSRLDGLSSEWKDLEGPLFNRNKMALDLGWTNDKNLKRTASVLSARIQESAKYAKEQINRVTADGFLWLLSESFRTQTNLAGFLETYSRLYISAHRALGNSPLLEPTLKKFTDFLEEHLEELLKRPTSAENFRFDVAQWGRLRQVLPTAAAYLRFNQAAIKRLGSLIRERGDQPQPRFPTESDLIRLFSLVPPVSTNPDPASMDSSFLPDVRVWAEFDTKPELRALAHRLLQGSQFRNLAMALNVSGQVGPAMYVLMTQGTLRYPMSAADNLSSLNGFGSARLGLIDAECRGLLAGLQNPSVVSKAPSASASPTTHSSGGSSS